MTFVCVDTFVDAGMRLSILLQHLERTDSNDGIYECIFCENERKCVDVSNSHVIDRERFIASCVSYLDTTLHCCCCCCHLM